MENEKSKLDQMKEWYPDLTRYFDAFDPDNSETFAPPEETDADTPDVTPAAKAKRSSIWIPIAIVVALAIIIYYILDGLKNIPAAG